MRGDYNSEPHAVEDGILRATFRLPLGIDHVHCYFLRGSEGGWILVDTALGFDDPEAAWGPVLAALDAPVERIVVTHLHPDHIGGAADVAALTGAPVFQGRIDWAQAAQVWTPENDGSRIDEHLRSNGMPEESVGRLPGLAGRVRIARDPQLLDEGDTLDGWQVLVLPGHADGHIVLERDGVLVAGDTILASITPTVGLFPESRPDPLEDFVHSLERIAELRPRLALPGHGRLLDDAVGRAREIVAHHTERLDRTADALEDGPRDAWQVALAVFERIPPGQQRFALTESLAHLERLVRLGRARRVDGLPVRFSA
jgi:glyoxylase-like metal-dependent hydrolase (beta-lactamase superfamily II)